MMAAPWGLMGGGRPGVESWNPRAVGTESILRVEVAAGAKAVKAAEDGVIWRVREVLRAV